MRAGKPRFPDAREAPAFVPLGKPGFEGACERFEDASAGAGGRSERSHGLAGIRGRRADIDADANGCREAGCPWPAMLSIKMPAILAPPSSTSFGHL